MAASCPSSNSRVTPGRWFALGLSVLALALAPACVEHRDGPTGVTSLAIKLLSPASPGTEDDRLGDDARTVTIEVSSLGPDGELDPGFSGELDVFTHFLGTLTPDRSEDDAELHVTLAAGVGEATLEIPLAFGATYLWVEDARDADEGERQPTYATGTSDVLWFRDPFLDDLSRPLDETRLDALERSPLEQKQVRIDRSRHGALGHIVVTAVYAQGFTISDVRCEAGGCTAEAYDHMFVFSFGRPRSEEGVPIAIGHELAWVAGGVGEFNGFTELNFPQASLLAEAPNPALLPSAPTIDGAWLLSAAGPTGMINLERLESGLVTIEGGRVCPLDDDYTTYKQWKVDVGNGCGRAFNVITDGALPDFDPAAHVGDELARIVGSLRSVNIGSFNVWIVYPRRAEDVVP